MNIYRAITLFFISFLLCTNAFAAPKAQAWKQWQAHQLLSSKGIDHSAWSAWLQTYVTPADDGIHRVNYAKVTQEDRKQLKQYIQYLENIAIEQYTRDEQYAFWMNLYNAVTVNLILEHYPVKSIRNIGSSVFGIVKNGPWGKKLVRINNTEITLNDIEHRILRPLWNDPRTHYGLNCASLGCPNLAKRAFNAKTLHTDLDTLARAFINHPRGVTVKKGKLTVSSIYHWFKEDFGGNDQGVIKHIKRYANPELLEKLKGIDAINRHQYNWKLNQP